MKSLIKISKLKLVGLIALVPLLIAGTVVAYNIATPSKTTSNSTQTEQTTASKNTDKQAADSEQADTTSTDQTASEPTASTSTQSTTETPKTTVTQPTQTATSTTPQQTTTSTTPQQTTAPTTTPTCNESMKSSYASLYNSQVNAENASWTNQINAWNDYAAGHGMAFSGYTQSMIDQYKPAHDARLAQLQAQYYQNLASINCNP